MDKQSLKHLWTINEVAAEAGVAEATFRSRVKVGTLPKPNITIGKRYVYDLRCRDLTLALCEILASKKGDN